MQSGVFMRDPMLVKLNVSTVEVQYTRGTLMKTKVCLKANSTKSNANVQKRAWFLCSLLLQVEFNLALTQSSMPVRRVSFGLFAICSQEAQCMPAFCPGDGCLTCLLFQITLD